MEAQRRNRLILVPCPFQGHITPMLQLGTVLQSKGFVITVAHTKFNSPNPSYYPDFKFLEMPDGLSDLNVSSKNLVSVLSGFNINCKIPLQEALTQMVKTNGHREKIGCIIYDEYMYFSNAVANHLQIPSIILSTSSAANMLTYQAIPRFLNDGYIPLKETMLMDPVPELQPLRFKDLPFSNATDSDGLLQLISEAHKTRTSSAIIWNTAECLEQSSLAQLGQGYQIPFFPIGPMHKMVPPSCCSLLEEDYKCISWLDEQMDSSVIYVSLGSIASMDEKGLVEMAWGLANSKQPFLWVVRIDSSNGRDGIKILPESFEKTVGERGYIVNWAPQKEVLAHRAVGGFWSHCGWNSTIESVSEGVPMICQSYFGDQKVNARFLSQVWGVGIQWESDLERGEVGIVIRRLMVNEEGKVIRHRAIELKEKIEISIKQGGSSSNSLIDLINHILLS
ncbi:UDP-glucose iridoid glucosyltransferase-like [Humulus lupulus]|uniref:UDP-glucose iridoid glucosyltransferase-like n=1 Tax=Humulus lupulus TaxID=3486 RepID=UPI002B40A7DC|nr:UDP-glucose iridoid glucosyltransferase-like [Humulus lupulus]